MSDLLKKISCRYYRIKTQIILKGKFYSIGKKTVINKPMQLDDTQTVKLGNSVYIAQYCWLMGHGKDKITMQIDDNTTIGHFAHIIAYHSVKIEKSVLIADRVFISDCTHSYNNIDLPVLFQKVNNISNVKIGEGTWIGENVCILGASIGKHCVIGSNSVVTKDIPDFCVAIGAPAKIIKKYDKINNEWQKV